MSKIQACAYCGEVTEHWDMEHVIPRCLYPPSKATSKVQRLTVPACRHCNDSWSDCEPHFRNILTLAADTTPAAKEVREDTERSLKKKDGLRRMGDMAKQLRTIRGKAGKREVRLFLSPDKKSLRVVAKVIRGLSHHHELMTAVSERRVWVKPIADTINATAFMRDRPREHREEDILSYRYSVVARSDVHSIWLLTFFGKVNYLGLIASSKAGFRRTGLSAAIMGELQKTAELQKYRRQ